MPVQPGRFLYFGFGSNLLRERLRLANKSAEFVSPGRLPGHRVEFSDPHHSQQPQQPQQKQPQRTWHGGAATLVPAPPGEACEVYGAVWSLADADAVSLDKQEGVPSGMYERVSVPVELVGGSGQTVECRSYRMVRFCPLAPSPHYLDVILRGAIQCQLPGAYVESLRAREHNGYTGECRKYAEVLHTCGEGAPPCQVEALRRLGF